MEKIMLAMSGGVDSSVALLLLKKIYTVIGGTLKVHDYTGKDGLCGSDEDIELAKKLAEKYGIDHHVFDMRELFRETVIKDFCESYLNAETPNPCVICNSTIKFGALLEEAKKLGCEKIATGHYAVSEHDEKSGRWLLKKSTGKNGTNDKDQTYVLYRLTQEQLSRTVFPLGSTDKSVTREIARENSFSNSEKPDSQDICFVPNGDYADIIEEYIGKPYPEGNFIDENGNVIGHHKGIIHYTIGQRRGIGVGFGKPVYVTNKNSACNTVTLADVEYLMRNDMTVRSLNWISIESLTSPLKCKVKTRYKQTEQPCEILPIDDNTVKVVFDSPMRAITPGQHAVFYDGDIVIGGGIIC